MEMPDIIMTVPGADTIIQVKAHQMATHRSSIVWASFIGAGNTVKALRGSLPSGISGSVDQSYRVSLLPASEGNVWYEFRHAGLGSGYVHVTLRLVQKNAIVVLDRDDDGAWFRELTRITTAPVLREWVPWLREQLMPDMHEMACVNCDVVAGPLFADYLDELIVQGVRDGHIPMPEAAHDFDGFGGKLSDYIHTYAGQMLDAAGGDLLPVFNPQGEQPTLLPIDLTRKPFLPQGWVIEAVSRHLAV